MCKRIIAILLSSVIVSVVGLFFFVYLKNISKNEGLYSGKYTKILSLIQDDKNVTIIDLNGACRDRFILKKELQYHLKFEGSFCISQTIKIKGQNLQLKYRVKSDFRSGGYHIILKPGMKQRFDLLLLPQWEISSIHLFFYNFYFAKQCYSKVNYKRD